LNPLVAPALTPFHPWTLTGTPPEFLSSYSWGASAALIAGPAKLLAVIGPACWLPVVACYVGPGVMDSPGAHGSCTLVQMADFRMLLLLFGDGIAQIGVSTGHRATARSLLFFPSLVHFLFLFSHAAVAPCEPSALSYSSSFGIVSFVSSLWSLVMQS
jgi:hypothetical protein